MKENLLMWVSKLEAKLRKEINQKITNHLGLSLKLKELVDIVINMVILKEIVLKGRKNTLKTNDNLKIANILDGYDNAEMLLLTERVSKNKWVMDSGCIFHITLRLDLFVNIKHINSGGKVFTG